MSLIIKRILGLISVSLLLAGCQQEKAATEAVDVLVRVNGAPVTQAELDYTLARMLGPDKAYQIDAATRKKVLQSLVMSRVMAQNAQKTMAKEDLKHLEQQVSDYKEQLLVKQYLRGHIKPQPVTQEMIKEYYEKHKDRFGGALTRQFEMITTTRALQGNEREPVLRQLELAKNKNWKTYVQVLKQKHLPIAYRTGNADEKLLHTSLRAMLATLKINEVSKPFFIEGRVYLVKVIREKRQQTRPLNEVSAMIRQSLAPMQLQKAIAEISAEIIKTAKIEYVKNN